jgi:hypothetical protein
VPETAVPGGAAQEVLDRLEAQLARDPNVVILANFALDTLPVEVWSQLYRRVAAGMGLVLVNHDPPADDIVYETFIDALSPAEEDPINHGTGAEATADWAQMEDAGFAAHYGEGRVVTLGYGPDRPETHCLIPAITHPLAALPEYFDNYLALMGRAVLWAAGRDAPLRVNHVEQLVREGPDETEIPPELPEEFVQAMRDSVVQEPIKRFLVSADRPAERDYTVRVQVRDPNRNARTVYADLPKWEQGQQQYLVEFLSGPGVYFLDIFLESRKGVEMWHTESIEVRGWPTFEDLRLSKDVLLPNDALDVSVEVRALPSGARPFNLYARGVDNFDRVVTEAWGPTPEGGGRASLRVPFSDLIGRRVKLEVYALEGSPHVPGLWELGMAACAVRLLPVRQPRELAAAGAVVCAEAASEYNARRFLAQLRGTGANAVYTVGGEGAHRHILALGMRPVGSVAEVRLEKAGEALRRDPCLSDESFRAKERQRITELAGYYARGGLLDYGLGNPAYLCASDENVCQSAHCLAGFRKMLRSRYGDIGKLNAAWGTNYADFDAVVPFDAAQARQENRYAPWVSFRTYMAAVFAGHLQLAVGAVAAADSHARTGARLLPGLEPTYAYDVPALAGSVPMLAVPAQGGMLHALGFHQKAGERGGAVFDSADDPLEPAYARWLPWRAALLGIPETWLVNAYGTATRPTAHAVLRADGAHTPVLDALAESMATLNDGYGALLRAATPVPPEVAVVTSLPARYLHAARGGSGLDYDANLEAAIALLEQLGHAPAILPAGHLAAEDPRAYRALLLPAESALSREACDWLTQFAAEGGLLIAGLMPGVFDDAGAAQTPPPLAALFGVECRGGAPELAEGAPIVSLPGAGEQTTEGRLAPLLIDTGVTAKGADTTQDGEPAYVWVQTENTLLLNHLFPKQQTGDNAAALRILIAHFLARHDVAPPLLVEGDFDGARRTFALGDARIHALLPRWDAAAQHVQLRVDKGRHASNLLHGDGATAGRSVRVTVEPGACALVSDLPYGVTSVDITAPRRIAQGERLPVQVRIAARGETGHHVVRLTLETGMGARVAHYTTMVTVNGGFGETFLPLARNELSGTYFLRAQDLLTGIMGRGMVEVVLRDN